MVNSNIQFRTKTLLYCFMFFNDVKKNRIWNLRFHFPVLLYFVYRMNREFFRRQTSTNLVFYFFNFCPWQAIICGKIGQSPVQKILRNGNSVTIFTVGTGGLYDQRITDKNLPKPAQWHRIAVHNKILEAYAVKQLVKKYRSRPFNLKYYTFCVKLITKLFVQLASLCWRWYWDQSLQWQYQWRSQKHTRNLCSPRWYVWHLIYSTYFRHNQDIFDNQIGVLLLLFFCHNKWNLDLS